MMKVNTILQGDALTQLRTLPDESVDCVMTSPPYWALRDYGGSVETIWDAKDGCAHTWQSGKIRWHSDRGQGPKKEIFDDSFQTRGSNSSFCTKCGAWKGQLGLEPTLDLYLDHMCAVFDEVKRVLKKTGTCFVNLGDAYSGGQAKSNEYCPADGCGRDLRNRYRNQPAGRTLLPDKSLRLIPFRFAIEMVNRGWILRNTIIWHKPNCMPASTKDRFTVDFDYLFFFTKSKLYWFERQFEPNRTREKQRSGEKMKFGQSTEFRKSDQARKKGGWKEYLLLNNGGAQHPNPIGRNKRCVWTISTKPFREAHFATYPEALCETPIKAGCPECICVKCGKAREKIYQGKGVGAFNIRVRDVKQGRLKYADRKASTVEVASYDEQRYAGAGRQCVGYTDCCCNAGWRPGMVLDPFFGSGTTGVSALKLNRQYIGLELNPHYIAIAKKRLASLVAKQRIFPVQFGLQTSQTELRNAA